MSCRANERHITFEEGCWTFHPNSVYHSVMLSYLQEEHVSCQCTFGSRLHEEREKVNSLCECSKGSFLTVPGSTVARPGPAEAVKLLVVSWSVVPVDAQGRNHNSLWDLQWVVMGMIIILAIFVWVFSSWIGKNEAHRLRIMAERNLQVASF